MTDRIHVLATFDTTEDLLAAMRRAVSWVKFDEAHALSALATEESLKLVLTTDRDGDGPHYTEREVELAIEVFRCYAEEVLRAHQRSPESIV